MATRSRMQRQTKGSKKAKDYFWRVTTYSPLVSEKNVGKLRFKTLGEARKAAELKKERMLKTEPFYARPFIRAAVKFKYGRVKK